MSCLPDSYLVIDTETNSVNKNEIAIVQFGWCYVIDQKIADNGYFNLAYGPDDIVMNSRAYEIHKLSFDILQATGLPPAEAMEKVANLIVSAAGKARPIVGHNLVGLDFDAITKEIDRHKLKNIVFSNLPILDTGVVYKSYKLNLTPKPEDTLWSFFRRVREIRAKGVTWSLDTCIKDFGIESTRKEHNAGEDCYYTHLVLEEMRARGIIQSVLGEYYAV